MARWNPPHPFNPADPYGVARGGSAFGSDLTVVAVFAIVATIPGLILLYLTPPPLWLPAVSAASLAAAAGLTLVAWWLHAKRHTDHINLWDIAGIYAFIGFAAGMLSKPEHVLQFVGLV